MMGAMSLLKVMDELSAPSDPHPILNREVIRVTKNDIVYNPLN